MTKRPVEMSLEPTKSLVRIAPNGKNGDQKTKKMFWSWVFTEVRQPTGLVFGGSITLINVFDQELLFKIQCYSRD